MHTAIDPDRAKELFSRIKGKRVLVLGDIMLDEYLWGECERISPEAPVPVVHVKKETFRLGGAGNVANNVTALGGEVTLLGVTGADRFAEALLDQLKACGIPTEHVLRDPDRPTLVKTRVVAHSQQIVRADRESVAAVEGPLEESIVGLINEQMGELDAVIVSDYGKGVCTPRVFEALSAAAGASRVPILVDPSVRNFRFIRGATLVVPNTLKARLLTQIAPTDDHSRVRAGKKLVELAGASVLLTLGESGMMLFHEGKVRTIPAVAREVYDVTGASDTVVSSAALAYSAGATMEEAANLANFAAGVVVGKIGTSTVTAKEILKEIRIKAEENDDLTKD